MSNEAEAKLGAELVYNNKLDNGAGRITPCKLTWEQVESGVLQRFQIGSDIVSEQYYEVYPECLRFNLLNNYKRLPSWSLVKADPQTSIYFMVFKPMNEHYDPHFNGMDAMRKYIGKVDHLIITREINSAKVHYNAMIWTDRDMTIKHEKHTKRYYVYCVCISGADRFKVHDYIVKESHTRYFNHGQPPLWKYNPVDIYVK